LTIFLVTLSAVRRREVRSQWATWLEERMSLLGYRSNSDLARESGVPDSVLSRWRNAGTRPSLEQVGRLQPALQAPLLELLVAAGHLTPDEAKLTAMSSPVRLPRDVRDAIELEPELPDDFKHLLLNQYDAMLAVVRARRQVPLPESG
jgi:transcriptional regulator with XRE-family HTH domain